MHVLGEVPHGARALHLSFLSFDHSTWQRFQISQFHAESAAPNMGAWETCRKEAKENEMNSISCLEHVMPPLKLPRPPPRLMGKLIWCMCLAKYLMELGPCI